MTFFHVGNLTVLSSWIAVLVALLLTMVFYRVVLKKSLGNWFSDTLLNYILIWKFSYAVFHFKMFFNMPISVLYFNGGTAGHWLASFIVTAFILFKALKTNHKILAVVIEVFLIYFALYKFVLFMLEQNILFAIVQAVLLLGYLIILRMQANKMTIQLFGAIYMVELLLLSIEQTIFTTEVLTFGWFSLLGFVMLAIESRRK